jgi:ABC-type glycerol-3-phosphate transport system substrate-binding protein
MSIILPTAKVKADRKNPKRLIIYSKPKTGKTSAFAGLENNLIIDLENGSDYVDALKIKVENLQELLEAGKAIKEAGKPYKYVTIDTVTALEDMVMPLAIKLYKQTSMGKNYDGDNVLSLPNGAGYLYLRQAFFQVLDFIDTLAPHIILAGHIKDKQVDDKGEMVLAANIDLTGKIKSLICANADAIGYMFRKGDKTILSFKTSEEVTCGARPEHLRNEEIVVSELNEKGGLDFHWDKIYV